MGLRLGMKREALKRGAGRVRSKTSDRLRVCVCVLRWGGVHIGDYTTPRNLGLSFPRLYCCTAAFAGWLWWSGCIYCFPTPYFPVWLAPPSAPFRAALCCSLHSVTACLIKLLGKTSLVGSGRFVIGEEARLRNHFSSA